QRKLSPNLPVRCISRLFSLPSLPSHQSICVSQATSSRRPLTRREILTMRLPSLLTRFHRPLGSSGRRASRRGQFQPQLENLEDRRVLSTLTVGPGKQFATIQAAVNAAQNSGDIINVYTATYQEQVVLGSRFTSLTL